MASKLGGPCWTMNGVESTLFVPASRARSFPIMDLLSDLFREAGLRRRLLDVHGVPPDLALRFPCERSLGFHVVLEGTLYVHPGGDAAPLRLEAGDVAVMGRGADHRLAARAELGALSEATMPLTGVGRPAAAGDVRLVSGAYQLWHAPVHPLFAELPPWFVRRAERARPLDPISLTVAMLAEEARREAGGADALGRETVVHALLDVLFTRLLREMVAARGAASAGWSHAVRDPQVRAAVAALHADCARPWTLEALARAVGLSRSALAERFRGAMGETPLAYLRTVRMQRAMRLLAEGDGTLEQAAVAVGYGDAFSFSKAFKRAVGVSPGEFRRGEVAARALPWRLGPDHAVGAR
jgi:AraC-like DNA-binding protein